MDGRVRTGNYSQDARWRLADAIKEAREAAGYKSRPRFWKAAGVSKRSLENVESRDPAAASVGEMVLRSIGRALPNWTEDTPRIILEGGPVPPIEQPPQDRRRSWEEIALDDLNEILTAPRETLIKISQMVEKVNGSAAAEKFLLNALELRRQHADQRRDISPSRSTNRDVS